MHRRFIIEVALCSLVLTLNACKGKKHPLQSGSGNAGSVPSSIPYVMVDKELDRTLTNASFKVVSWTVEEEITTVVVNYSGGCKTHRFNLYSDAKYTKSIPPQLHLYLRHENHGDACRRLIRDTLRFHLAPVRYPGQKALILKLNNTQKTVRYPYDP